MIMFLIHESGN